MQWHYLENHSIGCRKSKMPDVLLGKTSPRISELYSNPVMHCNERTTPPHQKKRFQPLQRRTSLATSLLSWLSQSSTVRLRRHVRHSKNDPLVKEVKLMQANAHYATDLHLDGRRDTVLSKDMTSARVPPPIEIRHGIATRTNGPTWI